MSIANPGPARYLALAYGRAHDDGIPLEAAALQVIEEATEAFAEYHNAYQERDWERRYHTSVACDTLFRMNRSLAEFDAESEWLSDLSFAVKGDWRKSLRGNVNDIKRRFDSGAAAQSNPHAWTRLRDNCGPSARRCNGATTRQRPA
jgi:hypothetical protein